MHGVEHVARLSAKFKGAGLFQLNRLGQSQINIDQSRTRNAVAASVTILSRPWSNESSGIKPIKHCRITQRDGRSGEVGAQTAAGTARNVRNCADNARGKWRAAGEGVISA